MLPGESVVVVKGGAVDVDPAKAFGDAVAITASNAIAATYGAPFLRPILTTVRPRLGISTRHSSHVPSHRRRSPHSSWRGPRRRERTTTRVATVCTNGHRGQHACPLQR